MTTRTIEATKTAGTRTISRTSGARWLMLLAVLALLTTACVGGGNDELSGDIEPGDGGGRASSPTTLAVAPGFDGFVEGDETPRGESGGVTGQNAVLTIHQLSAAARDIIYRGDMTVSVTDVVAATASAITTIESLGGLVFGQQSTGNPAPRSVLTFKVLPDDFQTAMVGLGSLGDVLAQNVTADDVTDRVVDLQSRIRTAEASVERLRSLLDEAGDITTIAQLENQLLDRETQLETLRGQLRTVQDQVALATIVLTLTEAESRPQVALVTTAYPGHEDAGRSCPGDTGFDVVEGDPLTVCFEVVNQGDTRLTGFTLSDPVLDLQPSDLIVVYGDLAGTLEPGQSLIVAAEIALERDVRTQTRVEATPVDIDGHPLGDRKVAATSTVFLNSVDAGGLPGFGDGLEASWGFLMNLGGVVVLVAGAALPFLWLVLVAGALLWWRGRHRDIDTIEPPAPTLPAA